MESYAAHLVHAGHAARRAYCETFGNLLEIHDPWSDMDDNARRPWIEAARAARAVPPTLTSESAPATSDR